MRALALVVLASVQIGGVFGTGSVDGRPLTDDTIEIDLSVQGPPQTSVVAHLISPGGPQETVAMAERRFGEYGAVVEVPRSDLVVVFEAVGERRSDPVTLTRLGLDRSVLGLSDVPPEGDPVVPEAIRRWGWLGLALGTGALALVAVWALGERREGAGAEDESPAPAGPA